MRQVFKQFAAAAAFMFTAVSGYAQLDSPAYKRIDKYSYIPYSLTLDVHSGSNGFNQYMMNRLAFGGYMPSESIEKAESLIKKNNRSGFYMNATLEVGIGNGKDTGQRRPTWRPTFIGLNQFSCMGAQFGDGIWKLIFRGNENYLGKQLELLNTSVQQFTSRTIYARFGQSYSNKNGKNFIRWQVGFSQILAYRNLKLNQGFLYTDSNRNYLEAQYNLNYTNTGRDAFPGVGYGISTAFESSTRVRGRRLDFSISNFGIAKISDALVISKKMDSAVRIEQSSIGLKSLNSSDWVEYFRDTLNRALAPDSQYRSKWIVTPFFATISFAKENIRYTLDYLLMPGYLPRLTVSHVVQIRSQVFMLTPAIQLGGFDRYNVNLGMTYHRPRPNGGPISRADFQVSLGIRGLEAWVLPQLEHGAGVYFSATWSRSTHVRIISKPK